MSNTSRIFWPALAITMVLAAPASAHTGGNVNGLVAGLSHPVSGLDHIVAMVAVGMWGGILGRPAIWMLPIVFPLMMAVSGALAIVGVPLPGIEVGIGLSGIVLGLAVLLVVRPPILAAMATVGFFAIFHGYAHGAELPGATDPALYAAGFVIATGLLHLVGIAFGLLWRWPAGKIAIRAGGAAIALTGAAFLFGFA